MTEPPREKKARGTARVAFIAHLDTIVAALEQGYTARAIYQRHQTKLGNASTRTEMYLAVASASSQRDSVISGLSVAFNGYRVTTTCR
jgi:hypothetical protein